eukprot:292907-Prymnesium_polylepis.1
MGPARSSVCARRAPHTAPHGVHSPARRALASCRVLGDGLCAKVVFGCSVLLGMHSFWPDQRRRPPPAIRPRLSSSAPPLPPLPPAPPLPTLPSPAPLSALQSALALAPTHPPLPAPRRRCLRLP